VGVVTAGQSRLNGELAVETGNGLQAATVSMIGSFSIVSVEEIRTSIGADSLGYVSLEELTEATTLPADRLCRACFDGVYPVPVPEPEVIGKHLLEGLQMRAVKDTPSGSSLRR